MVTNLHDHGHVHLHGPGDWASIIIAIIVITGVIIAVSVVACVVRKIVIFITTVGGEGGEGELEAMDQD